MNGVKKQQNTKSKTYSEWSPLLVHQNNLGGQLEEGLEFKSPMFSENIINLTFCTIQCRKDHMQVYYVDKNMVEHSSTVPYSINKEYLNHTLGLTLSTSGLFYV